MMDAVTTTQRVRRSPLTVTVTVTIAVVVAAYGITVKHCASSLPHHHK